LEFAFHQDAARKRHPLAFNGDLNCIIVKTNTECAISINILESGGPKPSNPGVPMQI